MRRIVILAAALAVLSLPAPVTADTWPVVRANDAPISECEYTGDLDALVACYERETRETDGPPNYEAEFHREILEPCVAELMRAGRFDGTPLAGLSAREFVALMRSVSQPEIEEMLEPLERVVKGRPREIRQRFYEAMIPLCVDDAPFILW